MHHTCSIENNLIDLGCLNHHLGDEVAKLPEIQNVRNHSCRIALANLIIFYQYSPYVFDRMFESMNEIGKLEHRKYCSPLQALFWLIQDKKLSAAGMLLGLVHGRAKLSQKWSFKTDPAGG